MSKNLNLNFKQRIKLAFQIATAGAWSFGRRKPRALEEWLPSSGDADTDSIYDLPDLRKACRDLTRNSPIAAAVINTKVTSIVGTGLKFQSQVDGEFLGLTEEQALNWQNNAEREFNYWALDKRNCDFLEQLNFFEQQDLVFRNTLDSGDCFANIVAVESDRCPYTTRIQFIEADRVSNPDNRIDTDTLVGGIEKTENGIPIRAWVNSVHPGSLLTTKKSGKWAPLKFYADDDKVNLIHLYTKKRIGQTRGIPDLAPIVDIIKQISVYTKAEIDAAVVTSFLAIITKTPQRQGLGLAALDDGSSSDTNDKSKPYKLGPALVLDLKEGTESVETIDPSRPNVAFDPFMMSMLRLIGAAIELPLEILIKHFTSSYSAARAALENAKQFYKVRRSWLACNYCQPVLELVLTEAILMGRLSAPGFLNDPLIRRAYLGSYRNQWIGPSFGQIDPLKDFQSREIAEDRGWLTAAENTAEISGGDFDNNVRRRIKENSMRNDIPPRLEPIKEVNQDEDERFEQ